MPPRQGMEALSLYNDESVEQLRAEIVEIITDSGLNECGEDEKAQIVNDIMREEYSKDESTPVRDAAVCFLVEVNYLEMISRHAHYVYPDYDPLHRMMNKLGAIASPAISDIFGKEMPIEAREAFPGASLQHGYNQTY